MNLSLFKALIKDRCGLLCEGNAEEVLIRAITERRAALQLTPTAYHARLMSDAAEFQELVNLLTINETYFFREPEQIRLLVDCLVPRLLAAHNGLAPVRILSAGCSSGEEPYSLVMALMDKYGESVSRLFRFVGGDIDSTVLHKARQACYTDFSFRGVSAEIRSRYFHKDGWGNTLKSSVRSQVRFHELNLLAPNLNPELRDFDIIFFRNVSIYFDTPTRKIIQANLAQLMKPDGFLVIGIAETLANDLGVLPLMEENGLFYFVKGQPPLPDNSRPNTTPAFTYSSPESRPLPILELPAFFAPPPPPPPTPTPTPTHSAPADFKRAHQLTLDKRYDEALIQLNAVLVAAPQHQEACLLKAHVLINRKDFAGAQELAQHVLTANAWSIDAHILLGLAAKWRGQSDVAIGWFKRAVYANHECWPAHYYLAELYRQCGELDLARRAYRGVVQLLLQGGQLHTGLQTVPLALPATEVRFLCEHQLAKLPAGKVWTGQG